MSLTTQQIQELGALPTHSGKVRGQTKIFTLPPDQALGCNCRQGYTVLPQLSSNNVPATLFNGSSNRAVIQIVKGAVKKIEHVVLAINVTVSNSASVLLPVTDWFSRMALTQSQDGQPIKTWLRDVNMLSLTADVNQSQLIPLFKNINVDYHQDSLLGAAPVIPAGTTKTFYYPLRSSLFQIDIPWESARYDLYLELSTDGIVASGGGTVTCNSINLLLEGDKENYEMARLDAISAVQLAKTAVFTEPVAVSAGLNKVLTSGTNTIDMSEVSNRVGMLVVGVRATGATAANLGYSQWVNIGDESGAALDLLDSSGNSMLGGTAWPTKWIRNELYCHTFPNNLYSSAGKPLYVIPHSKTPAQGLSRGVYKNALDYGNDQKYRLQLTCKAAVNEVQTITLSAAAGAGQYRFFFRGEYSAPVQYNDNTATMATALQAMKVFASRGITVAFSAALSAGTSATATFTTPQTNGLEGDILQIIPQGLASSGGASVSPTVAITTPGQDGIVSGTTYDVCIYAMQIKKAAFANGELTSYFLGADGHRM